MISIDKIATHVTRKIQPILLRICAPWNMSDINILSMNVLENFTAYGGDFLFLQSRIDLSSNVIPNEILHGLTCFC